VRLTFLGTGTSYGVPWEVSGTTNLLKVEVV